MVLSLSDISGVFSTFFEFISLNFILPIMIVFWIIIFIAVQVYLIKAYVWGIKSLIPIIKFLLNFVKGLETKAFDFFVKEKH